MTEKRRCLQEGGRVCDLERKCGAVTTNPSSPQRPVALGGGEDAVSPLGPPQTEDAMYSCLEMNTAAISAVVHLSEYGTRVLM